MSDEFGIGFRNSAVLEISPPILSVQSPHFQTGKWAEKFTVVWVQFMLLNENQIIKEPNPAEPPLAPTTNGDWGHF